MNTKCKKCGGINCQCKNTTNKQLEQEKAEQATYEKNSNTNTGGLDIDDTGECESCQ